MVPRPDRIAVAADRRPFVLSPVFIGALVVTALSKWQITGDGGALLFEGAALVGLYVILATLMWFE
jgi:hypothetical protein